MGMLLHRHFVEAQTSTKQVVEKSPKTVAETPVEVNTPKVEKAPVKQAKTTVKKVSK